MQPLNFCRKMRTQFVSEGMRDDEHQWCIDLAKMAHKFILPHNGVVMNDPELRALDIQMDITLPFDVIALEFTQEHETEKRLKAEYKNILFVADRGEKLAMKLAYDIRVTPDRDGQYCDGNWAGFTVGPTIYIGKKGVFKSENGKLHVRATWGTDQYVAVSEQARLVKIFLSFVNALACSNVRAEKLPRIKMGKHPKNALPFDDYHVLTVRVPGGSRSSAVQGAGHRSPREHLRRGHIRRLEDRKIWVNATVVCANKGLGKIAKDYAVKA